jgi:hypothetical protein
MIPWTKTGLFTLNTHTLTGPFSKTHFILYGLSDSDASQVCEFVEIIQATVPRADLDRHRQLRFDLSLPRVGLRMNMDLTTEGVQKILDHVLELKSSA